MSSKKTILTLCALVLLLLVTFFLFAGGAEENAQAIPEARDSDAWYLLGCAEGEELEMRALLEYEAASLHQMILEIPEIPYEEKDDIYLSKGMYFYPLAGGEGLFGHAVIHRGTVYYEIVYDEEGEAEEYQFSMGVVLAKLRGKTSENNPGMLFYDENRVYGAFAQGDEVIMLWENEEKKGVDSVWRNPFAASQSAGVAESIKRDVLASRDRALAGRDKHLTVIAKGEALQRGSVWPEDDASYSYSRMNDDEIYFELLSDTFTSFGWAMTEGEDGNEIWVYNMNNPTMEKGPLRVEADRASRAIGLPGLEEGGEYRLFFGDRRIVSDDFSANITLNYCMYVTTERDEIRSVKDIEVYGACIMAIFENRWDNSQKEVKIYSLKAGEDSVKADAEAFTAQGMAAAEDRHGEDRANSLALPEAYKSWLTAGAEDVITYLCSDAEIYFSYDTRLSANELYGFYMELAEERDYHAISDSRIIMSGDIGYTGRSESEGCEWDLLIRDLGSIRVVYLSFSPYID